MDPNTQNQQNPERQPVSSPPAQTFQPSVPTAGDQQAAVPQNPLIQPQQPQMPPQVPVQPAVSNMPQMPPQQPAKKGKLKAILFAGIAVLAVVVLVLVYEFIIVGAAANKYITKASATYVAINLPLNNSDATVVSYGSILIDPNQGKTDLAGAATDLEKASTAIKDNAQNIEYKGLPSLGLSSKARDARKLANQLHDYYALAQQESKDLQDAIPYLQSFNDQLIAYNGLATQIGNTNVYIAKTKAITAAVSQLKAPAPLSTYQADWVKFFTSASDLSTTNFVAQPDAISESVKDSDLMKHYEALVAASKTVEKNAAIVAAYKNYKQ